MSSSEALAQLTDFMHKRNEFDYDECQHGFYSGPLAGEAYAMCERQAEALMAAGYGKLNEGSPVEWGVRWPLSSEAHGPGKFTTWEERSRDAAEAAIEDAAEDAAEENEEEGPSSATLVWRRAAGPWQVGEPPKPRKASRDEILTARKALDDYLEELAIGIRSPVNQMRLVEALKFFLEGNDK